MKQIIKQIKKVWNSFLIIFTISKAKVGGEIVSIDAPHVEVEESMAITKETSWFATANNLMDGDWTGCAPKVESSRFGSEEDWVSIAIRKEIAVRKEKEEVLLADDVEFLKNDPNYAKVVYPDNTVELKISK